jgi:hypothetical protein
VVALEKGVVDELPVGVEEPAALGEEVPALEAVVGELGPEAGQLVGDVDRPLAPDPREDHTKALGHRHRDEPELAAVELGEGVAREGLAEKRAVEVICPRVVRALERAPGASAAGEHAAAAVAADVEERAYLGVLAADQQQRYAGRLGGDDVAGVGQVGAQPDDERPAAEERVRLGLQPLGGHVDRRGLAEHGRGHRRRVRRAQREELLQDRALGLKLHLCAPRRAEYAQSARRRQFRRHRRPGEAGSSR